MGKRDDKLKHKKNKKSTAMLVLIIAIIVLLILFIVLGSTLGGWIKALKDKSSQSSSSSVISSSSITSASDTVTDSSDSGNSNGIGGLDTAAFYGKTDGAVHRAGVCIDIPEFFGEFFGKCGFSGAGGPVKSNVHHDEKILSYINIQKNRMPPLPPRVRCRTRSAD